MWALYSTELFLRQLKRIRKTPYSRHVEEALRNLVNAEDPTALGTRKRGEYSGVYSYEIGKSVRLIYSVDFKNKIIRLVAVGTHKEVYGSD